MPVPLKIILTHLGLDSVCDRCRRTGACIRIDLFTRDHSGQSDPLCLRCLETNAEVEGALNLVELTVESPTRRRRVTLHRQKKLSRNQEVEVALELNASVQRASGALKGSKGDGRRKGVLRFEAKYTEADSYQLKLAELEKIAAECHGRERPIMVVDFKQKGTGRLRDRFAVVRFDDAKEMFNAVGHDR